MEGCISDPDDESDSDEEAEEREADRRSQLDTLLSVPTNVPSNALVRLSVGAMTTFINSPVCEEREFAAYSLSKLHSTSNRAMAQMEGQQIRTGQDWPPEQLGGHRVGLKHPPAVVCVAGCAGEVEEPRGEGFVWLCIL